MPVTTYPASHGAKTIDRRSIVEAISSISLLKESCKAEAAKCDLLVHSSFPDLDEAEQPPHAASPNAFVFGCIKAHNEHLHLTLRPDDVWLAILTQLKMYINEHADEMRGTFVPPGGKEDLEIRIEHFEHLGQFAVEMSSLIEKNLANPGLRQWILPAFSTTTETDKIVASIVMMGAFQKYFRFVAAGECGIPSVTLLGERQDWESLLLRLETIPDIPGDEPKTWYSLLKPVCTRFVRTFDEPNSPEIRQFWRGITSAREYMNMAYETVTEYSGWITAFCFWGNQATCQYGESTNAHETTLTLDGVRYGVIDSDCIPDGWASTPVTRTCRGDEWQMTMVAGSVAMQLKNSNEPSSRELVGPDSIQPRQGWWAFNDKNSTERVDETPRSEQVTEQEKPYPTPTKGASTVPDTNTSANRYFVAMAQHWLPPSNLVSTGRSSPIHVHASSRRSNSTSVLYLLSDPVPANVNYARFTIESHDQGWSGEKAHHGTYMHSYTWFEATIFQATKQNKLEEPTKILKYSYDQPVDCLDELQPLDWTLKAATLDKTEKTSRYAWPLQHNVHASRNFKRHCVTWSRKPASRTNADDGSSSGEGFISTLSPGDRVGVWARALYPGWTNSVSSVKIELAEHLDDFESEKPKDPLIIAFRSSVETKIRASDSFTEMDKGSEPNPQIIENPGLLVAGHHEDTATVNTVHYGVTCDGPACGNQVGYIKGIRYNCTICRNTDFCEECLARPGNSHDKSHPIIGCTMRAKLLDFTGMSDEKLTKTLDVLKGFGDIADLTGIDLKHAVRRPSGSEPLEPQSEYTRGIRKFLGYLDQAVSEVGKPEPVGEDSTASEAQPTKGEDMERKLIDAFRRTFKAELDLQEGRFKPGKDIPPAGEFTEHGLRVVGQSLPPDTDDCVAKYEIGPDFQPTVEYRPRGPTLREERADAVLHSREHVADHVLGRLQEHTYIDDEEDKLFLRYAQEGKAATRVIELLPGDGEDELRCRLIPIALEDAPNYEALSYTWKETTFERANHKLWDTNTDQAFRSMVDIKHPIYLPRGFITINNGLRDALRRLRHKDKPRYIWADQISINQKSLDERELQVGYMHLVYNRSQRVLVWVGEADEHTTAAFSMFERLAKVQRKGSHVPTPTEVANDADLNVPPFGSSEWAAVLEFFKRPVFQRGWVIQEITLGQALVVVCGEHEIEWTKVARVADLLGSPVWAETCWSSKIALPNEYGVSRHGMVGTMNKLRRKLHTRQELSLNFLLKATQQFAVTDPRDKIYAILGICNQKCNISASYTKPASEVFIEAAKWIIDHEKTLDLFGQLGASKATDSHLPSWVPDYGSFSDSEDPAVELGIPQANFRASGDTTHSASWPFPQHPTVMELSSYHADTILATADVPPDRITSQILWMSQLASTLGPKYVTGETTLSAFWRTCVTNASASWHEHPALQSYLHALGAHAWTATSTIEAEHKELLQSLKNPVLEELVAQCSRVSDKEKGAGLVTEVIMHFGRQTFNRKMCTTKAGYLCLAPQSVRVGDEVHVLAGAKVPFVLRKAEGEVVAERDCGDAEVYSLVGETYVHGLMGGEALYRDGFGWRDVLLC